MPSAIFRVSSSTWVSRMLAGPAPRELALRRRRFVFTSRTLTSVMKVSPALMKLPRMTALIPPRRQASKPESASMKSTSFRPACERRSRNCSQVAT